MFYQIAHRFARLDISLILDAFGIPSDQLSYMTKYIIGTISSMDTPLTPNAKGARSMSAWMTGLAFEDVQKERDEVLSCGCAEIRALAPYLKAVLSQNCLCVIGNEEKLEEQKDMFGTLESLFH